LQQDTETTKRALVNRIFVQKYVSGRDPLGLHFGADDPKAPQWEIVGVVGDTKYSALRRDDAPTAYMPLASGGATFAVRTALAPASLMPAVRNVVNSVDANVPVMRMRTQSDSIDRLLFNERLVARLLGLFATVGLMLSCIGLYGLLSYEVERPNEGDQHSHRPRSTEKYHLVHGGAARNSAGDGRSAGGLRRGVRCYAPPDEFALCRAANRPGDVRSHCMPASPGGNPGLFSSCASRYPRRSDGCSAL